MTTLALILFFCVSNFVDLSYILGDRVACKLLMNGFPDFPIAVFVF